MLLLNQHQRDISYCDREGFVSSSMSLQLFLLLGTITKAFKKFKEKLVSNLWTFTQEFIKHLVNSVCWLQGIWWPDSQHWNECPGSLWGLHPWRCSKPDPTHSWAPCSHWSCLQWGGVSWQSWINHKNILLVIFMSVFLDFYCPLTWSLMKMVYTWISWEPGSRKLVLFCP